MGGRVKPEPPSDGATTGPCTQRSLRHSLVVRLMSHESCKIAPLLDFLANESSETQVKAIQVSKQAHCFSKASVRQ